MLFSSKLYFLGLLSVVALVVLPGCGDEKKEEVVNKGQTGGMRRISSGPVNLARGPILDDPVTGEQIYASDLKKRQDAEAAKAAEAEAAKMGEGAEAETPKAAETSDTAGTSEGFDVSVAKGALNFMAPSSWEKTKPRSFVVEYEIAIPKSKDEADDAANGRLTIMGAGGSVQANIDRWYGQYSQPDGSKTADVAKVTESEVGDCKITWVDMSGTLMDKPGGPMAGGKVVERENYRTLAAIIQAGEVGQYFVKVCGPKKTITENEPAFKAFVESLKLNSEAKGL